jgi:hypothetical protein
MELFEALAVCMDLYPRGLVVIAKRDRDSGVGAEPCPGVDYVPAL